MPISEEEFYIMLAEIHNAVADYSCGCMGSSHRTATEVKFRDKKEPIHSDYIGSIVRKYIKVGYHE